MKDSFDDYFNKWIESAQDYPTKALLIVAQELFYEQHKQLELHKGKLDGGAWSPESWND